MLRIFISILCSTAFTAYAEQSITEGIAMPEQCHVDEVTTFCRDGLQITLPGCSVVCRDHSEASCTPARLDYNSCDVTPAQCECSGRD